MSTDKFLIKGESYKRLVKEYNQHKELVIGVDFDGTIHDYHKEGFSYEKCHKLLRDLKRIGCKIICWTAYKDHDYVTDFFINHNLPLDGINCDGVSLNYDTRKPFFNALLDDRAGLLDVYNDLIKLVEYVESEKSVKSFDIVVIDGEKSNIKPNTTTIKICIHNDDNNIIKNNIKNLLDVHFESDINFRNTWNILISDFDINNIDIFNVKSFDQIYIINNLLNLDTLALSRNSFIIYYADDSSCTNILKKYENKLNLDAAITQDDLNESVISNIMAMTY